MGLDGLETSEVGGVIHLLLVPTYVASSHIAGMGLFAGVDLPAGEVIWEFTEDVDWRIDPEEFERFPEPYRSLMRHYIYQEESGALVLCGDNARFMNHEAEPNCLDTDESLTVTAREIRAGEELTCDYRLFDREAKLEGVDFGQ